MTKALGFGIDDKGTRVALGVKNNLCGFWYVNRWKNIRKTWVNAHFGNTRRGRAAGAHSSARELNRASEKV